MSTNRSAHGSDQPGREPVWQLMLGLFCVVPILFGGPIYGVWTELAKPPVLTAAQERALREASLPALDLQRVARGKRLYEASCIACHAADARGVPNLGRDLVGGYYTRNASDWELLALIIRGRQQGDKGFTGPVAMPPRGGRDDFSDDDIISIVAYLRALQVPTRIASAVIPDIHVELLDGPESPEPVTTAVVSTASDATASTSEVGPTTAIDSPPTPEVPASSSEAMVEFNPDVLKRGKRVYASCIACHGKDGSGIKSMGASLIDSAFIASKTDAELRDFIKIGRQPGALDSRLNLNMPPKGGNPALKDNQLDDVVVYLRWLRQQAEQK